MNIPQYVTQLTKDWFRNVSKTRVQGTCIRIEDAEDSYTIGVDVEALKKLLDIDPQSADLSNVENGKIVVGESYTEGGVSKKRLTCVSDFAKDVDAMLIRTTGTNHKVEVDAKKVRFKSVLGSPVSGDFVCLDSNLNLTAVSPETKLQGYATANALAQVSATASSALDASSSAQSTASAANTTANSALDGLQTLQAAVDNNTTSIGLLDTEVGTINESLRQLIDVTIAQMDADIETAKTTAESAQTTAETFDGRIGDIEDDYLTSSDLFDANGNKLYVDTSTNQTVRGNKTFVGVTKHSNWVGWGGDATSSFHICGGDGWRDGSHLILSKNGHSGSGAGFSLVSSGGPNVKYHLLGNENGELTWDGSTQKSTDKSDKQLPTLGYLLQNFMTLETEQEITGRKRFSSTGTAISLNVFADGLEMFQFRKGGDADASALIYSPNQPIRIYASNKKILLESSSNNGLFVHDCGYSFAA